MDKCPLCKGGDFEVIYDIADMPIFQNKVYDSVESSLEVTTNNISLCNCNDCNFVFNKEFDTSIMTYDKNYQNEQSHSVFFKNYLDDLIEFLGKKFTQQAKIIEIGSGKGYFLNLLESSGFENITGFDPAYEGEKNNVIKDYYSSKYKHIYADLIILRHTLEHISNPFDFIKEIAEANNYSGKIFIEVPCFDWIKKKEAFWDIFYEHCNYFTKASLSTMFNSFEVGGLFNGQYIYILADLKELKKEVSYVNKQKHKKTFALGFGQYLESLKNGKYAVWGAGAKGVTFLNALDKNVEFVKYVVDINPKKQNKYLPKTSHKVIDVKTLKRLIVKKEIDSIYIMNENYKSEIMNELHGHNLTFKIL